MRRAIIGMTVAAVAAFFVPSAATHSPAKYWLTSGHDSFSTPHEHADWVWAYAGDDLVSTADGSDEIHGGMGDDSLYGGYGDDYLEGGIGADVLVGGPGVDVCIGNSGADTFLGCEYGG